MSSITTNSNDLMIDESTKVSSSFSFKDSLVRSSSNPCLNSESDSLEKTRFEKHKCHHHHRHHRHHHHHRSTVTTNMNKIPNQNPNQIPYQNSHQIPYQNLNQIPDQNSDQNLDQNPDHNPNLDNNQSTSQSSNLNLNQKSKRSKRTVQTEQPKSSKIPLPSVESSSGAPLIFEIKVKLAKLEEELYRKNGAQMSLFLDTILDRLDSSENLDVVIGSLSTLNEILCPAKDLIYSYERYLKGRVDRIVLLCAKQYRFFFTVYLTPDSGQNLVLVDQIQQLLDSNSNLLNYLLCTCPVQLEGASRESLHQLMQSIIPFLAWHHQLSRDCNKKRNHFRGIYFDSVQNLVNELLSGISTNFRLHWNITQTSGFTPKPTDRILVIGILFRMLRDLTTKLICTENGKTKKQIKLSIDALTSLIHNQRFESNSKDSRNIQMVVYEIYSLFEVYSNFDEENEMSRILRCVESYLSSIFTQIGSDSAWKHFDLVDHELTVTKRNFENVPVFGYLANQGFMRNSEFVPKLASECQIPVSRIASHTLSKVSSSYWENFEKFHIVHRRLMEKYLTDADAKRTERKSKKSKMNSKPQQIRVQPKSVTPPETLKLIDLAANELGESDSVLPKSPTESFVSDQCPKTVPNGTNNRKLKVQITKSLRPSNLKFVLQSTPNSVEESDTVSGMDSNSKHSENKTDFLSNVVESLNMTISGLNLENPLETNEIPDANSVSESDDSNADDDDPKRSTDSFVNLNLTDWSKEIEEFQKTIDSDPEMVMLDLDDGPLARSLCPELVKFFSDEPIQEEEEEAEESFEILKTPEPENPEVIKMVLDSEIPETKNETKQNPTVEESNPTPSHSLEESTIRAKVQKTTGMHKFEKAINELLHRAKSSSKILDSGSVCPIKWTSPTVQAIGQ